MGFDNYMCLKLYVSATRQNDGKTIVSLGLLGALKRKFDRVGYIKPVGQQYVVIDGHKIDKDAVLMKNIYDLEDNLSDMSPIAVPSGFTERYILYGKKEPLRRKVKKSFVRISKDKDFVLIEGTGHAGVGSVFDMSNSQVAKMLKTKVIIVSCGGIGKPIDEIMLNKARFDQAGVTVIGAIINKVRRDKYEKVNKLVRRGLMRQKIETLGVIPFDPVLSNPTLAQLLEDINGKLLCGEKGLSNTVSEFIIGAMPPHEALNYLGRKTLLITPGNRDDLILTAMSGETSGLAKTFGVAGIILTCGIMPHKNIFRLIKKTNIPMILVKDDTFAAATRISNLIVKIRVTDNEKIKESNNLIGKYVDIDKISGLVS